MEEASSHISPFWFRNQVKNGAAWDFKQEDPKWEDYGNLNYGATGTEAGFPFPPAILKRQAGAAQVSAGNSNPGWGKAGWLAFPWTWKAPYGDQPRDQYWIQRGIEMANCLTAN
jgi:hypothetical protein